VHLPIAIIGAGGHGREIAEIVEHAASVGASARLAGFIDEDALLAGRAIDGIPVLGNWQWLEAHRHEFAVIVANGTPPTCCRVVKRVRALGAHLASAISPLARISSRARLEEGVIVFPHVIVNTRARVGAHATLNVSVTLSHDSIVGPYTNVNPGAHLAGNVRVGEGCYIGMGTNVIQDLEIGAWTTVGAGAVVTTSLPDGVVAVGVPARIIKRKLEPFNE
jgi:sugar O-acyltransferase (sialic acid O-acetyltransferase NeuD family)